MKLFNTLALLLILTLASSCGKKPPPSAESAQPIQEVPAMREAPETFTYVDAPTPDLIPNHPVKAKINDRTFEPGLVYFTPGMEAWSVKVIEKKHPEATDAGFGDDGMMLDLEFGQDPAAGKTFIKEKMEAGDGGLVSYYNGEELDNWSGPNAYAIQFTDWTLEPFDTDEEFKVAGKASGYLAICFQNDGEDVEDSWAAGSFTDIPILYSGTPYWLEEE